MKVVIAMDSFKGSLTSLEAGKAVERGIRNVKDAKIVVRSIADGGEGTTEALVEGSGGTYVSVEVTGPTGKKTMAVYGILEDGKTAVMEMAQAAGIMLVCQEEQNPIRATTYGVGEMILDAIAKGCRKFLIGIGGSATSDGGVGMLQALGYRFLDASGAEIDRGICGLGEIEEIRTEHVVKELGNCWFQIACDVKNPLLGKNGAIYVYGPQKGIGEENLKSMDAKMMHYARKTKEATGKDYSSEEGAGAAGGLGFAFLSYMPHVELKPGIEIILETIGLEQDMKNADLVITGEGRLDGQTAMGKTPLGVARCAKKYGVNVLAFAGSILEDAAKCHENGIDAYFPIGRKIVSQEEAMDSKQAKKNLELAVEEVFRLISLFTK